MQKFVRAKSIHIIEVNTVNTVNTAHSKCSNNNREDIPVVFHNESTYDYHLIIKEIAKNIDGIECIGENSEVHII